MKKNIMLMFVFVTTLLLGCSSDKNDINEEANQDTPSQSENIDSKVFEEQTYVIDSKYDALAESIDFYLKDQAFNGAALIATGDDMILARGYGLANLEQGTGVQTDTKFQIASVSKSFVAVSIMQLIEKGELSLETTVDKFFPTLPHGSEITIHQLLTHTSALYSDDNSGYTEANTVEQVIADAFKKDNLYYDEPGIFPIYSNLGYDLLGAIIEKISGLTYSEYLRLNILKPLDMNNSGLNAEALHLEDFAVAYNGNISEGYRARVFNPSFGYASGGMHSTIEDLYKYDRALANNQLISQESYNLMTTAYTKLGSKPYGYGWYVDLWIEDTISHPGNLIGWHSMMLRHQEDKVTVILLTNHDESDMNMAYTIARLVLANVK
ncbi:MAG: serine hydrolase domain-containing protein [Turicibacter sp.]